MYFVGKTAQITAEMNCYCIGILGISKCRRSGFGRLKTRTEETTVYSGRDNDVHQSGVAIIMSKVVAQCLDNWTPINDRIIAACFYSRIIKNTVIQVYAHTNEAGEEEKKDFYEQLQKVVEEVPRHDMLLVMENWNANVGLQKAGEEGTIGKYGLEEERSNSGKRFVASCAVNNLAIV